jgi:hypothetical protein
LKALSDAAHHELALQGGRAHLAPEHVQGRGDQRQAAQREQREAPIEIKQRRQQGRHRHGVADQIERHRGQGRLKDHKVSRRAREDFAALVAGEVVERQGMQLAE